jgi:hypothetical protein
MLIRPCSSCSCSANFLYGAKVCDKGLPIPKTKQCSEWEPRESEAPATAKDIIACVVAGTLLFLACFAVAYALARILFL